MDIQQFKALPFYLKLASVLFILIAMVYIVIIAKEMPYKFRIFIN